MWIRGLLAVSLALMAVGESRAEKRLLAGPVTAVGTPTSFQVNGTTVECVPGQTITAVKQPDKDVSTRECAQHLLGESMTVYGHMQKIADTVVATRLQIELPNTSAVSGYSLVDKVLQPRASSLTTVRVDGYAIVLTPATRLTYVAPLTSLADLRVNVWLRYTGTLRTDGTVLAATATLEPNIIAKREKNLRDKNEFNAAAVPESERQGTVSKFFQGTNVKRIPAYQNTAMNDRLQSVGRRLIPAYERDLSADDPSRVELRFQLVDQPRKNDAIALPSGIILVPYQVLERLPDDNQLAAVLSRRIAEVLQKQALRVIPAAHAMTAAGVAGAVGGLFLPGLGIATDLTNYKIRDRIDLRASQQDLRVGLAWMEDAGFDTAAAPVAWWVLASKPGQPLNQVSLPMATQYLYDLLRMRAEPIQSGDPVPAAVASNAQTATQAQH